MTPEQRIALAQTIGLVVLGFEEAAPESSHFSVQRGRHETTFSATASVRNRGLLRGEALVLTDWEAIGLEPLSAFNVGYRLGFRLQQTNEGCKCRARTRTRRGSNEPPK
jgi:hypothetical protein